MRVYPLNFTAVNTTKDIYAEGAFFRGISGTAVYDVEPFDLHGNSLGKFIGFQTALGVPTDRPFAKLSVTSATVQNIEILIHDREVLDNRLTGIVNITGGISSKAIAPDTKDTSASVSVGVAATLVLAAGTLRGNVILQNMSTASIYIGVDNTVTTANGICLNPSPGANQSGGMIEVDANSTIYAIATAAASDLRVLALKYSA